MNLQPAKKHESVTILMVPHDGYSSFPRAVDALLKETRLPFELIIVEGSAPDSIRHELEKKRDRRKNIKIIYSNHRPRLAQAFNLGLPHIRTRRAFLMHNDIRVTPQWLESLIQHATGKSGVICPFVADLQGEALPKTSDEPDMHGFLIEKETLSRMGEFDEKVASPLLGADFGQWLKKQGIPVHKDPYTILEDISVRSSKSFDMKMFQRQWDEKQLRESLAYLNEKWGLKLSSSKYLAWIQQKKHPEFHKPALVGGGSGPTTWQGLPTRQEFPKLSLKKFLQVLTRA